MGAFAEPPAEAFEADPLRKPEARKSVRASFLERFSHQFGNE
jgi:hypothetical protein